MLSCTLLLLYYIAYSTSTLLTDYIAPEPIRTLGTPQCEKNYTYITPVPTSGGCFITPAKDPSGRTALHFHRDPAFMRSEIDVEGPWAPGEKYYMGYEFMLGNVHEGLWIMQWKKKNATASPVQNVPFNIGFTEGRPPRLALFYVAPGKKRVTLWSAEDTFSTMKVHRIGLAWDTDPGSGSSVEMWLDGKKVLHKSGLDLWTGMSSPKVGMYRAQKGSHDTIGESNVFDNWVYKVMISNGSMSEVAAASGVDGRKESQGRV